VKITGENPVTNRCLQQKYFLSMKFN